MSLSPIAHRRKKRERKKQLIQIAQFMCFFTLSNNVFMFWFLYSVKLASTKLTILKEFPHRPRFVLHKKSHTFSYAFSPWTTSSFSPKVFLELLMDFKLYRSNKWDLNTENKN